MLFVQVSNLFRYLSISFYIFRREGVHQIPPRAISDLAFYPPAPPKTRVLVHSKLPETLSPAESVPKDAPENLRPGKTHVSKTEIASFGTRSL